MASDVRFSTATLNGFLDTINTRLGSGALLRFYSGTKPANADAALSGNTVLAELALSATPFAAASSRSISANAISNDTSADATGTCTFASFLTSGGTRVVDVTVGTSASDIIVNTVSFVAGAQVSVSSMSITLSL